jgi:putative phage-type endonuclease
MSHQEWLETRKKSIGGSDIAAICGLSRYKSAIDVWADKTGRSQETPDNEAMRIGRDLEDYVAKRFCEETGLKVQRSNYIWYHDSHIWASANLDREIVGGDSLLECKTTSIYNTDKWADDKIPDDYYCQVQWYLGVRGYSHAYLACLILNHSLQIREIGRDDEIVDGLLDTAKDFWDNYVLTDTMPPPDGSKAASDIIKTIYADPDDALPPVDLHGLTDALKRYDEISAQVDSLERESDQIKQQIQIGMGDAETGFSGTRKITWKASERRSLDAKKLKAEKPETYEAYLGAPKKIRTLRIAKED